MDTDALVPMTLRRDHHIRLVQHKHGDLLRVDVPVFGAPVEDGAWCSDDNLLLQLGVFLHCAECSGSDSDTAATCTTP